MTSELLWLLSPTEFDDWGLIKVTFKWKLIRVDQRDFQDILGYVKIQAQMRFDKLQIFCPLIKIFKNK